MPLRVYHPSAPGEEIVRRICSRDKLLTQVFIRLGVSQETSMTDACKVEHNLSDEAFENIKSHAAGENKKRNFVRCDGRPECRPGPVPFGSSGRGLRPAL